MAMTVALTGNAQFEEGKLYVNTSLSGLNMSYNGSDDLDLGLQAQGGYMFRDNLMVLGTASFQHVGDAPNKLTVGAGGRYYIIQNGL